MKKKIISKIVLFAAIAVLVFGLAACGSANLENSKYLGVWQAVEASDGDKVIKVGEGEDSEVNMLLNFQSDGKVVVSANGKQGKGNWKEKDGVLKMHDNTGSTMDGTLDDQGRLVLTKDFKRHKVKIVMEKQE